MRILMSMFGWNDMGGGTSYPRQVAVDLVKQGHEVLVFYAAVPERMGPTPPPHHRLVRHTEEGVQLVAVHDRPALFLDNRRPDRELNHPAISASFQEVLTAFQPDVVHFHNFLGLSAGLIEVAAAAGVPSLFSAHNFWMICPTLYLSLPNGALCSGVNAEGSNCQQCAVQTGDPWTQQVPPGAAYVQRRDQLVQHLAQRVDQTLVNSECVRQLFLSNGHAPEVIHVQKLSNRRSQRIWEQIGSQRPAEIPSRVRIGYLGQVIPIKGVHLLVAAAQALRGDFEVHVYGEASPAYLQHLQALDQRQCVQFHGAFNAEQQLDFLAHLDVGVVPSLCLDHSPLVISEMHSAGMPVLGAEIGGIPDYLQAEASGLFAPGDVAGLTQLLQGLLDDRAHLQRLKDNIRPPEAGDRYLQDILARYDSVIQQAAHASSRHRQQRVDFFLQHRHQTHIYAAHSLWPQVTAEYGLDLHSAEDVASLKAQHPTWLAGARWRISPDPVLAKQLTAEGYLTHCVPMLSERAQDTDWLIPESKLPTLLLPLEPSGHWQSWLKAYLEDAQPGYLPLLLPCEQDFDTAQEALLNWLDSQGLDPEQVPEMVLLDTEASQWPALFRQIDLVVLPPPSPTQERLLPLALHSPHIATAELPEAWHEQWMPSSRAPWDALAQRLGQGLFMPQRDPAARLLLARTRMQQILESQT
ncbi:MAG: glycosyltransferase [Candidatus Sericytochromatia bacterium]